MTHRIASLDLLRGAAAFAVAIPHYAMTAPGDHALAETVSILGVEIFFVLSGYVLAPQILLVAGAPNKLANFRIFLVRRWMRTVPPYLIALVIVAITTHQLVTADFVRYALYVQNFAHQANTQDFFAIAWSLSVEEWFYLTFPPVLLLFAATARGRPPPALLAALTFIAVISALRFLFADWSHWGEQVRRIVIFRMDAIAWGFALHLATSRITVTTPVKPAMALAAASGIAVGLTLRLAETSEVWIEVAFHLYASALGAAAIVLAGALRKQIEIRPWLTQISFFLGRISYSTYLFHLIVLSALSRMDVAYGPAGFGLYLTVTCLVTWLMAEGLERPILSSRPKYRLPVEG
ncbi:acyltransferase family protein [Bradyrhizobium canariense]|uniref:acyltransferase family protein n=1 Tax=Bradyrhizobium canariense TaxID=255045 RepID=UPI001B8A1D5C|nr:acyltransferase [Bradyrhizobium canariense]MBR0952897.1 acyltransferase [Bradyrhizobium canariense]